MVVKLSLWYVCMFLNPLQIIINVIIILQILTAATAAGAIGVFIDTYGSGDYGYSLIVFMAGAALEFVTTLFAFFGRTPRRPNDAPSYDRNVAIGYSF